MRPVRRVLEKLEGISGGRGGGGGGAAAAIVAAAAEARSVSDADVGGGERGGGGRRRVPAGGGGDASRTAVSDLMRRNPVTATDLERSLACTNPSVGGGDAAQVRGLGGRIRIPVTPRGGGGGREGMERPNPHPDLKGRVCKPPHASVGRCITEAQKWPQCADCQ